MPRKPTTKPTMPKTTKTKSSKSGNGKSEAPKAEKVTKRSYLKQADVPNTSLDDALRLPEAIFDHYAGKPTAPFDLAKALNVDPKGSQIRVLSGAGIAFGLVEGGAQAASINVTELARRIIRPRTENEDIDAKREAVLKPRIFGEFLRTYNGNQLPREDIALNVLEGMGVPREKTQDVLERITDSARSVGFLQELKGKVYVRIDNTTATTETQFASKQEQTSPLHTAASDKPSTDSVDEEIENGASDITATMPVVPRKSTALATAFADDQRRRKVFITHGKDRGLVEPIKKLLEYGELEAVVSVERQSVSKPVPEKFMDDMRKSGAAIIHVDAEKIIEDAEGVEHVILNPNVLIEIGAAMAFYGRRFILLVREGVKLPSNLQGLYEVRYPGDTLDATSTIKLLEAMKDIKNYALPNRDEID